MNLSQHNMLSVPNYFKVINAFQTEIIKGCNDLKSETFKIFSVSDWTAVLLHTLLPTRLLLKQSNHAFKSIWLIWIYLNRMLEGLSNTEGTKKSNCFITFVCLIKYLASLERSTKGDTLAVFHGLVSSETLGCAPLHLSVWCCGRTIKPILMHFIK